MLRFFIGLAVVDQNSMGKHRDSVLDHRHLISNLWILFIQDHLICLDLSHKAVWDGLGHF